MAKKYNIREDLRRWDVFAQEIHARNEPGRKNSLYVVLQNLVENQMHRRVAEKSEEFEKILEIGVGGGEHICFEKIHNEKRSLYVGVDIALSHVQIAATKGIASVQADVSEIPFEKNTFDCCMATGVLEHIANLDKALREVSRVLRPRGKFLVTIPTNGGFALEIFKFFVSYPSMLSKGIQRPSLIWHHENVNHYKRVAVMLHKYFQVERSIASPFSFLPWQMSPLWFFECVPNCK